MFGMNATARENRAYRGMKGDVEITDWLGTQFGPVRRWQRVADGVPSACKVRMKPRPPIRKHMAYIQTRTVWLWQCFNDIIYHGLQETLLRTWRAG